MGLSIDSELLTHPTWVVHSSSIDIYGPALQEERIVRVVPNEIFMARDRQLYNPKKIGEWLEAAETYQDALQQHDIVLAPELERRIEAHMHNTRQRRNMVKWHERFDKEFRRLYDVQIAIAQHILEAGRPPADSYGQILGYLFGELPPGLKEADCNTIAAWFAERDGNKQAALLANQHTVVELARSLWPRRDNEAPVWENPYGRTQLEATLRYRHARTTAA